ncbi:3-hydroxyacyl-CoA dehydrogenase NAD-binding domain-containing protein [Mycolicibacterium bacteremicum]|uniref:3-hydroxyacyl-CoA dehydrogenase n=1 Tax=Mycolicibacterium bacteremicum TaxID=564198 RepID=A0A1W9YWX0_MYCBA|nr:3-hydroxyacyl-CoA dehydrogenase NAD-binding domain-containing protein [Mycolicibacterium bacteremicum]MCV7431609.1 enoyl-CoA hydratase/isomerase family protein [Mycolicibacterium bacteremicum]ORA04432.1 3-hydroxyacyl-CoA dehydrogenase [Mycolicibacterium bacteremicum]
MTETVDTSATIRWDMDADGIVVLTLDDPQQSANTMNTRYVESMGAVVQRLEDERETITGVVITSAKKTFFAGGDLNELLAAKPEDAADMTAHTNRVKGQLRRLEKLGKPVVAAINGAALGGGLEIALATHHRIAVDARGVVIGLPEVGLGLLPGGGGIVRTVRMLGIDAALNDVLLQGPRLSVGKAVKLGLVDRTVGSAEELLPAAKAWITANPAAAQPWDTPGYTIPGGIPATVSALSAVLRKQLKGSPLEAPRAIMAAAVEGAQVDFDTASSIETRYFVQLATGQVAKNMIKAYFFDLQAINAGKSRPEGYDTFRATKVGILGAGMMGAGIAYVSALAGIEVVLKDVDIDGARRGKQYAEKLEAKAVSRGAKTAEQSQAVLDRITATDNPKDFAGVDFVIEAVFESVELKQKVFQEIQDIVNPDAVLGSNTSTLPITTLAEGVDRQEDFIGIHFFSPVDKMPLVEIITGKNTSEATLAKVFDYTLQIRKTPIVVNDSRGFFTSRVIGRFIEEALAAVGEGVDPSVIEQAGLQAGYPAPPLQLLDELTLTLPRKIRQENRAALEAAGGTWVEHGCAVVFDRMIDEFDRKGRSTGGAFYEYDENGKRTRLWPGIREHFTTDAGAAIPFEDLKERFLFSEAIDTVRCFDEGVLNSVADANIGSLFGIGFPSWTGGVVQYINGYPGGLQGFVDRARQLAERYGNHFLPPESLVARAAAGETLG